jgi:N-acetyl-gamma-glutamyl-phosphate reductase common form
VSGPRIPAVVLGGTGYVAGELLRVLAAHPVFRVVAAVSESRVGEPVAAAFPHLADAVGDLRFAGAEAVAELAAEHPVLAVCSGLPHGEAAARIDALLAATEDAKCEARVVDCSADFRHADPGRYAAIYGHAHGAPARLAEFGCAVPEHWRGPLPRHVAHPGCFTTAATLAIAPLLASRLIEPRLFVSAITGSTGAGRKLTATTHHPERRSELFAYTPMGHRHEPEMRALAAAVAGVEPEIAFAPQAGPFARGIYAVVHARLARSVTAEEARAAVAGFYAEASFVRVLAEPPHLAAVVGTNRADLSVAVRGGELVAFSAIDNLVKGAAGGAVQWMNRLFGLPEATGLALPGLGWF